MEPIVHSIFENQTSTWQYIVACPQSRKAAILDPVLDFDSASLKISTTSADELLKVARDHNYTVVWLLETHAHADHLTAAHYIQQQVSAAHPPGTPKICTGKGIRQVQATFARKYRVPQNELDDAFDHLFQDDEVFHIGSLTAHVRHLPGHTPDHSGYQIGSNVFVGDSIFNPDVGSARCDFPHGDAIILYQSIQKLLSLPLHCRLYTGHDYPPADSGRDPIPYVTVAEQRKGNKHVSQGTKQEDFVRWRRDRDSGLGEPKLLHPALQVNIRGGRLPLSPDGAKGAFLLMPVQIPGGML
ncbi:hypothetical protein ARAM_003543 [Aspergillus rambellii]|uniref:Metallo-beta-lactamase domain-containing protein n=1 Tax=Aspergillus rambellii TaxID=308745 RepID=A0A0F8XQZ5_9EURO|nr:hypothetical protein ARAM_003543 [Aspergillus rambellii]